MRFLLLIFIINLFFGQILTGKICLMHDEHNQVSVDDLVPIAEKLRAQILFITFFYSKIDVLEDTDDILDLNDTSCLSKAKYVTKEFFLGRFSKANFKKIEAYFLLADNLNLVDGMISKLFHDKRVDFFEKKIISSFYNITKILMHQLSLHMSELEHVFLKRFTDMILEHKENYITKKHFYKIITFFESIVDRMIKEQLDLFLYLEKSKHRLELLECVFSRRNLFPNINWVEFRRNFNYICNLKSGVKYELVLDEVLCDV